MAKSDSYSHFVPRKEQRRRGEHDAPEHHPAMSKGHITATARSKMKSSEFAGPDRSYPIPDKSHARNALSRVSQFGSSSEKAKVRAKVHKKFPSIGEK